MMPFLEVTNLDVSYGMSPVIRGLNLSVAEGQVVALLGANGAGKTTTLRALCRMGVRTDGQVRLGGKSIEGLSTHQIARRGVAHVPDGRGTFLGLTTEENLRLGAHAAARPVTVPILMKKMFGYFPRLEERRNQQAGTLSGGEQQMLAIARALMSEPRILLLDEPSFGLAPLVVRDIFDIMRRINAESGVSILIVEQNAALALSFAHHAYLLETGEIVMHGSSTEMRSNPAVKKAYLGQ
ncbi:ABC transporter ATP-binding protein [Bosea sp. F3-2]|uniref:ABC transporter ATP-binding protein n=1 Tax=Bosea sp. F3-2 TaxID=2599640 RepID=UPI0011EC7A0B|nr:ABC transporter ATP-binding protein [Bosea sp. F3-2]QEL22881.1 ABC transporter ATP-binding protein [Bosea sp. F3-2]